MRCGAKVDRCDSKSGRVYPLCEFESHLGHSPSLLAEATAGKPRYKIPKNALETDGRTLTGFGLHTILIASGAVGYPQ